MTSLPDIAGANATVPFSATNILARVVFITVAGAGTIRWGGPEVTATQGQTLYAGQSYTFNYQGRDCPYSLRNLSAYIPTGATLEVAYEPYG